MTTSVTTIKSDQIENPHCSSTSSARLKFKELLKGILMPDQARQREIWVRQQLEKLPNNSKLLDAGCGTQPYRKYCSHLDYSSQDFGKYDGRGDDCGLQNGHFAYGALDYQCDIWAIPAKDAQFDAILCTEVIEHIPFPNETISEFARLLKPGGRLILTAPFCSIPHMTPYYFYNGFSKDYYKFFLSKAGFEIEQIDTRGDPFRYVVQEYRRLFSLKLPVLLKLGLFIPFTLSSALLSICSYYCKHNTKLECDYLVFGYQIVACKK